MPSPKYKVSLKLPNQTYSKSAPTILEALNTLKLPQFFKGKGIITVQYGKLKAEVWMWPVYLRKLFVNQTARLLLQKRLLNSLK